MSVEVGLTVCGITCRDKHDGPVNLSGDDFSDTGCFGDAGTAYRERSEGVGVADESSAGSVAIEVLEASRLSFVESKGKEDG